MSWGHYLHGFRFRSGAPLAQCCTEWLWKSWPLQGIECFGLRVRQPNCSHCCGGLGLLPWSCPASIRQAFPLVRGLQPAGSLSQSGYPRMAIQCCMKFKCFSTAYFKAIKRWDTVVSLPSLHNHFCLLSTRFGKMQGDLAGRSAGMPVGFTSKSNTHPSKNTVLLDQFPQVFF